MPGQQVAELWHNGNLLGTVCGADGPGVRIISKYPISFHSYTGSPGAYQITIETGGKHAAS